MIQHGFEMVMNVAYVLETELVFLWLSIPGVDPMLVNSPMELAYAASLVDLHIIGIQCYAS